MRYKAVISYLGTRYVGWQKQLNGVSVQETLEKALEKLFGTPTPVTASGRTDAGVHAEGQVVHFDAQTSIPTDKLPFAVNNLLPDDISMLGCEETDAKFNARFLAKRKTYRYMLYLSKHRRPLLDATHEHICVPLDVEAMRTAAKEIEGTHDFKCFEAAGSVIKNTVRTVYAVTIDVLPLDSPPMAQTSSGRRGEFDCTVHITVTGNGFLYNMVRIIAGTLVYVGLGKLTAQDVRDALDSHDRTSVGKTLPAKGLHLLSVSYT